VAEAVEIVIGGTEFERIEVAITGPPYPAATDYWDGNWLRARISANVGGFVGEVRCDMRTEEFARFRQQLERLYEEVEGDAEFSTLEYWLTLRVHGDGPGHVHVDGELFDRVGRMGNCLRFELEIDRTYLPPIIDALAEIESRWPIKGRP
jgi:hypothetical protein